MGNQKTKIFGRDYWRWRVTDHSHSVGVQSLSMEKPKSNDGGMIVGRSLQQELKPGGRSTTAGTLGASSGRGYIRLRGMVTRIPRRGWV